MQVNLLSDENVPAYTVRVSSTKDSFAAVTVSLGITERYEELPEGLDTVVAEFATALATWAGSDSVLVKRVDLVATDITPTDPA
jgi:hypothetical protein